jgi:hypothetical protein
MGPAARIEPGPKSFWGLNWLQNQDFGQSITKARLLCEVHKQFLMGHKYPNKIVLQGMAYERLGELSGAGSHPCTIAKIRKIIPALAGCLFKYRTEERLGEGNFLSYRYERAINGNYSVLIIEMQPLACPGFVTSLPRA